MASKVCAVLGVGPGLGFSVAKRFSREGFTVVLLARDKSKLSPLQQEIQNNGGKAVSFSVDAADPNSISQTFKEIRESVGSPDVLVYNAGTFKIGGIMDLSTEEFERLWKINCLGAFAAAKEVVPAMLEKKKGTILISGATASIRGGAKFYGFATGKFGLRAVGQSLARELGPQGIHVAHILIDGQIATPAYLANNPNRPANSYLDADRIAETYWQLHIQNETAWTQEMDLRPFVEKW